MSKTKIKKNKVLVFGTFDIFHKGHEYFFKEARKYGEKLVVVVARDKTVLDVKSRRALNTEKDRLKIIKNSNFADEVFLGSLGDKYKIIKKIKPDVICLGYDQNKFTDKLKSELLKMHMGEVGVVRLKSYKPEIYKSSKMRENK
jgi:FAD synthetase